MGYAYYIEKEKLLEYMQLSIDEKLQWLEELFQFTHQVLTKEDLKIRDRFRMENATGDVKQTGSCRDTRRK